MRHQELLYGRVGKLYHSGTVDVYDANQTGASGQYCLFLVLPPPIQVVFWDRSFGIKTNFKNLRELLDTKWTNGSCETLQETTSMLPIRIVDFHQYALVCLVQT